MILPATDLLMGALIGLLAAIAIMLGVLWWRQLARSRHLTRKLEEAHQRVDQADHALEAFFGLVSHEFRSPIAAIIGYQELLEDRAYGDLGDPAREPLDRIGRSAHHLLHLIDGALDLARVQAGGLDPDLQDTDLQAILNETAAVFRRHCGDRKLQHVVHVDDGLPTIRSDPERLARALHLLVISAVKHPSGDGLELQATTEADGATVRISGTAIPVRDHVADPALRTGIRIAIASAVADLLGGSLRLDPDHAAEATQATFRIRNASPRSGSIDPRR